MLRGILIVVVAAALCGCGPKAQNSAPAAAPAAPAPVAAPLDPASLNGHIIARGVGPAWRLDADEKGGLLLTLPGADQSSVTAPYAAPHGAAGNAVEIASGEVKLSLLNISCTLDGLTYPLTATATHAGATMHGCALVRWDRDLMALLPMIDACLSQTTEPMQITFARHEANGVFVRLEQDSEFFDCHAPNGAKPTITSADPNDRIAGDNEIIFVRAPGDNPGGECYQAPEVRSPDGTLIGWWDERQEC